MLNVGHMTTKEGGKGGDRFDGETDGSNLRKRGAASNFLDGKGFGWLLEVDDDDESSQKPLLYVNSFNK